MSWNAVQNDKHVDEWIAVVVYIEVGKKIEGARSLREDFEKMWEEKKNTEP